MQFQRAQRCYAQGVLRGLAAFLTLALALCSIAYTQASKRRCTGILPTATTRSRNQALRWQATEYVQD